MITPFNIALDEHLVGLGYTRIRMEASYEDVGNGETGPIVHGCPAYDEYTSPDDYVFFSENGTANHELRDLEFEAWIERNQIMGAGFEPRP